jgi:hypothetical protein
MAQDKAEIEVLAGEADVVRAVFGLTDQEIAAAEGDAKRAVAERIAAGKRAVEKRQSDAPAEKKT